MKKKKIVIKDKKIKDLMKKGGREDAKRDFLELLRRAAKNGPSLF